MPKKLSNIEFKRKVEAIWGDQFDLTKVIYKGGKKRIKEGCKINNHGYWNPIAGDLIYKKYGCPKCSQIKKCISLRSIPSEVEPEIKKRYINFKQSVPFISKELGFSADSIYSLLDRLNIERRKHKEAAGGLSESQIKELAKIYKNNEELSMSDLARQFQIANATVRAYLDQEQIEVREKGIPEEFHDEIIQRYSSYESVTDIKRKLGFNIRSINKVLKENNQKLGSFIERYGEEIRTLYIEGESSSIIAKKFKKSDVTIQSILRQLGIDMRDSRKIVDKKQEENIIKLYSEDKLDMRTIGKKFKCSKTAVKKVLKNNGVKIRTNSEAAKLVSHLSGWDGLDDLLTANPKYDEECFVYLYGVRNYPNYSKPGISKNYEERAQGEKQLYGDFEGAWRFETRRQARICELAILQGTSNWNDCPIEFLEFGGFYEVRKLTIEKIKPYMEEVIDDLRNHLNEGLSIYLWAVENIDMPETLMKKYKNKYFIEI